MDEFKQTNFSDEEAEREFTLTNIGDIQKLHYILENLDKNIAYLTAEQEKLGIKKEIEKPTDPGEFFLPWPTSEIIKCDFLIMIPGILFWPAGLAAVIIFTLYQISNNKKAKQVHEQMVEDYKEKTVGYKKELKTLKDQYENEINIAIPNLTKAIKKLSDERDEALKILNECYDLNVIPSKYRNIYAVTFLYDYLSTSKCSLRDALLACDLDKIQMQLDSIIENQRNMICRLAKIEANSEKQIKQQELMINQLKNIEKIHMILPVRQNYVQNIVKLYPTM